MKTLSTLSMAAGPVRKPQVGENKIAMAPSLSSESIGSVWPMVAIAGVLVLGAGAAAVVLWRRRKATEATERKSNPFRRRRRSRSRRR